MATTEPNPDHAARVAKVTEASWTFIRAKVAYNRHATAETRTEIKAARAALHRAVAELDSYDLVIRPVQEVP